MAPGLEIADKADPHYWRERATTSDQTIRTECGVVTTVTSK